MDKYEYKVKLAQLEKLVTKKDYVTAAKIADGIDWRKVKSVTTLNMVADIYEENNRLEDCYEILNMVYDRSPIGRSVVYHMTQVATKMHDFEEAIDLYKEFVKIAPHDLSRYILKYHIYRERGSSVEDQITILEEYKSREYEEEWALELAKRYEEAGMIDRCIEECDELILWFSEGEKVIEAMELKMKHQPLTASQQEKYEHRFDYLQQQPEVPAEEETEPSLEVPETEVQEAEEETVPSAVEEVEDDDTPKVTVINTNKFSTMNLQEELAKGLQMILAQAEAEAEEEAIAEAQQIAETFAEEPAVETAAEETVAEKEITKEIIPVQEVVIPRAEAAVETVEEAPVEPQVQAPAKPLSETAELKQEILKYASVPQERKAEEMFRTDDDGQITLAIGDENVLEKQITGQMTIEEILEAWEEKKRLAKLENEAEQTGREAVLFETGEITSLLHDFIPRTPRDVEEIINEIVEEYEEALLSEEETVEALPAEEPIAETPAVAEEPVEVEESVAEEEEPVAVEETAVVEEIVAEEEPATVEEIVAEEEPVAVEEAVAEELEDDLPVDLDLADVLEEALAEPKKEEAAAEEPKKEAVKKETPKKQQLSQNTASMLDAIERALAMEMTPLETAGKYLTEEQEKIFAYFTSVAGMKKQLVELMDGDSAYVGRVDSSEGNLIITGHPGNGKTTLAIDIVKAIQKQRKIKGGKLAKVTGDGFNKKEPEEVIKKLGGGALIIERAGSMTDETVEKLSVVMGDTTGGLLVILEDDAAEIAGLMDRNRDFAVKFNRSVDIPIFSNHELVAFGKSYAEEKEYYFDDLAVLALYDCIGVRQTSDHVVNITEVKEFVDDAIAHAEKKSRGFFAKLSKKRIDEDGNKLLLEEDFDY